MFFYLLYFFLILVYFYLYFLFIFFCFLFFRIKLKVFHFKYYNIFKIEVFKIKSKGNSFFIEKIGYYISNSKKKLLSINTRRLGFWLNRGALINFSVYKLLRKFLARKF